MRRTGVRGFPVACPRALPGQLEGSAAVNGTHGGQSAIRVRPCSFSATGGLSGRGTREEE
jgi:hypothetical protein